jgi:chlorobactene glucosyltransferase
LIFFALYFLNTLIISSLFLLTYAFYKFLQPTPASKLSDRELPFVSILVPARNEEAKIGRCLESLISQNYPNLEIVVIDDRSEDKTGEIIEAYAKKDSRIRFVKGNDAPAGWIGKCNALAHAVGYASGDWFIFTDADTYHRPNSVRDSVSYALTNKADLVSFVPMQELGSFWERLIMPVLLSSFLLGDPFHSVNDPKAARAYAYGQYIICRRSSYLALGGHQSVRDEIVEDHAIARVFKEKGYKIAVADGKALYQVRMYTDRESLWQGWTKNLYSLIDSRIGNLLLILILINCTVVFPYLQVMTVARLFLSGEPLTSLANLLVLILAEFAILALWFSKTSDHMSGISWKNFFLLPLGGLAVTVLYFHAAYLVLSGSQVNWKGRKYRVNTSKTIQDLPKQHLDAALDTVIGKEPDPS